jgi:tetratricopeptide (TPR) repeat protein
MQRGILGGVCALVIGAYAYTARSGYLTSWSLNAADNYYNLLVQGFRAGQLNLKGDVPLGLARLADPYNPTENELYRRGAGGLYDTSYYKGRLYIYFGVTPALTLFWPYLELTGHFLSYGRAGVIFCAVGFLAGTGLLCSLWRRYFAGVSVAVVAAGILALGSATGAQIMLVWCGVWEVATTCGYALMMLTLAAIWKAMHKTVRRCWWLAAAGLAYGLAVGARPSLLFGAVILLVPVAQAWRERRSVLTPLMAATIPIAVIGLGLMLYNVLRFDSPFEFGWRYMLADIRQDTAQPFHARYLWINFRVNFLEPARWTGQFPFVHDITLPPVPQSYRSVEHPFGVLTNIPVVWLALAAPLAGWWRSAQTSSTLCGFLTVVVAVFGITALTLGLFFCAAIRYEAEFLPPLVLLAAVGILSVERAPACQPRHRMLKCAVRWGWSLLLAFSVAFNVFASVLQCGAADNDLGIALMAQGRPQEAIGHLERALRIEPDYAVAHNNLGNALIQSGRMPEAIEHLEQALRINPDYAEAHCSLGAALERDGRLQDAIGQYEQALRLKPGLAEAHCYLGVALGRTGKVGEAISQLEQALQINPDYAEAHSNLGNALMESGRVPEAIGHLEQALRIKPGLAEAHYNFGVAFEQVGRVQEAIQHYEQALRIKPDFVQAQNALARARAAQ